MSSNDNGLYGFLKKKSVFSPNKANRKRSRSRSRDSRNIDPKASHPNVPVERTELSPPKNTPFFTNNVPNVYENLPRNLNPPSNNNYYPQLYTPAENLRQDLKVGAVRHSEDNLSQNSQNSQNSLWTGILSHSTSFESARVESNQCIENLSLKIKRQISNIHTKIDIFNSKMSSQLKNQFRTIKQKITQVFEAAFKESEKFIQDYMKQKEALLAGELLKMKETLEKELTRMDTMKDELSKPNWRKVAGEILATELEHKVQEQLKQSSVLEVGKWELGDIAGYRIKNIQGEIKEIVRLKA